MTPTFRMDRRRTVALLGTVPIFTIGACAVLREQPPEEGFEYQVVPAPVAPSPDTRPEVVEFFWYGCPHCRAFEPLINAWRRKLAHGVAFRKVHAALGPNWVAHQQMYFALVALDRADDETNRRVFDAIQVDGIALDTRGRIADFIAGLGIDRTRFLEAFDSENVRTDMKAADALVAAMGVKGVPNITVNGRWLTAPSMAGDQASTLRVVDYLLRTDRT